MTHVSFVVNGTTYAGEVEPRRLLVDLLRHELGLTGTHIGCEQGVCGTCTVQIDGQPARSCLMLAVQAEGCAIRTVEALAPDEGGSLHPLQAAFHEHHALQCGYCTPGFLMSIEGLLPELRGLVDTELREELAGNLCRCTGYQNIVEATQTAVSRMGNATHLVVEQEGEVVAGDAAILTSPEAALAALGITEVTASGPAVWRGEFSARGTAFSGTLELLDLDDDRQVANYAVRAHELGGPGQVRAAIRLSRHAHTVGCRVALELIGISVVLDEDELRTRLCEALAAWDRRPAPASERKHRGRAWHLVALGAALCVVWSIRRRRR